MPCDAQTQARPNMQVPEFNQLALCLREYVSLAEVNVIFPKKVTGREKTI